MQPRSFSREPWGCRSFEISEEALVKIFAAATLLCALVSVANAPSAAQHPLTPADLEAYLDGLMPYALRQGDIAGAVVTVVAARQVVLSKGYGYADVARKVFVDSDRTLFRAGSVSKLFVWTAVLQLVDAGKLDLDQDINTYLDFKIPPAWDRPVTLRNLMTHTAGFEDADKRIFFANRGTRVPLGNYIKSWTPTRIFPAGEVSAYSNYGAALAGYIVQRVSGEPFEEYVAQHIFVPLGMTHATFAQSLPARLEADMSLGYPRASDVPQPFELVGPSPAGALSIAGTDMARFMIAHLENGEYGSARILQAHTAVLMHEPAYRSVSAPQISPMALGFYCEDRNGRRIIGHEGDTQLFHSDLHLLLDEHVGVFISMNSAGKGGAAGVVRHELLQGFVDRYFPAQHVPPQPTLPSAEADGRLVAGRYEEARRSDSNFPRLMGLLTQVSIQLLPDGTLVGLHDWDGSLKHWREVAPFVWRQVGGDSYIAAVVKNGRIAQLVDGDRPAPVGVLLPTPFERSNTWALPVFLATCLILLVTVIAWPLGAFRRWRNGRATVPEEQGRRIHCFANLVCLTALVFLGGWIVVIVRALMGNLELFDTPLDPWLLLLNALGVICIGGALVTLYDFALRWRSPNLTRRAKIGSLLMLLSCVATVWIAFTYRLVTFSVNY
jgi:CubicO group peptidase (beta-lactamase class C family)